MLQVHPPCWHLLRGTPLLGGHLFEEPHSGRGLPGFLGFRVYAFRTYSPGGLYILVVCAGFLEVCKVFVQAGGGLLPVTCMADFEGEDNEERGDVATSQNTTKSELQQI